MRKRHVAVCACYRVLSYHIDNNFVYHIFWDQCLQISRTPAFAFDTIGLPPTVGTSDELFLVGRRGGLWGSLSFSSNHCVRNVRIRSYSVRMRENTDQNNSECRHVSRNKSCSNRNKSMKWKVVFLKNL